MWIVETTGIAVDCGDTVCFTVPIYEGFAFTHGIQRLPFGGKDIANYFARHCKDLSKLVSNGKITLKESIQIAKNIISVEKKTFTVLNAINIDEKDVKTSFKLPDGQVLF